MPFEWDIFLAHAGANKPQAEELFGYLDGEARVFLDCKRLLLGDDWDTKIAKAQQASLITLVLVSAKTEQAYYEREEIAAAIDMARKGEGHRLIPIYLDEPDQPNTNVPYGLRLKHGIRLSANLNLRDAATQLLAQLPVIKGTPPTAPAVPAAPLRSKVALSVSINSEADPEGVPLYTLTYESARQSNGSLTVTPAMEYLDALKDGGPVLPINYNWVPFTWDFPRLDFKVLNNSTETVLFTDLIFEISQSKLDPAPVLVLKPDRFQSNALHFQLLNEGWGVAAAMKARFHLTPLDAAANAKARFDEPYPHQVEIGDLDERTNVDVSEAFKLAGVDLARMEALGKQTMRVGQTLTLVNAQGEKRTVEESQYNAERAACFGPFTRGGALLSGVLEYTAQKIDGGSEQHSVQFQIVVWIYNENRKGVPRPPSYEYATKFKVEGENYQRNVSISQEVKAGESDRFLVKVGFDKSSRHQFRARLLYNNGRELVSPDIQLLGFAPRSGIQFLNNKPTASAI